MSNIKKKYEQKFRKEWLTYTDFKEWLEADKSNNTRARCKACNATLKAKLSCIMEHSKSQHHLRKYDLYCRDPDLALQNLEYNRNSEIDNLSKLKKNGWRNICTICLKRNRKRLRCIFDKDDENDGDESMIYEKISEISPLKIEKGMTIPPNICIECYRDFKIAYKFYKTCENSYNLLRQVIENTNCTSETIDNFVITLIDDKADQILKNQENKQDTKEIDDWSIVEKYEVLPLNNSELKKEHESDNYDNNNGEDDDENIIGTVLNSENFCFKTDDEEDDDDEEVEGELGEKQIKAIKTRKVKVKKRDKKNVECKICGNVYPNSYILNAHVKRHLNIKSFKCELCNKGFVIKQELERHMRIHTREKPYLCQYCGKKFADYSSRIRHVRTHTGERPYVCELCGKSFMYPQVLKSHLNVHYRIKVFQCNECSTKFTKKLYLVNHYVNKHGYERQLCKIPT